MSNYIRADETGGHIKPCPHCGNRHTVFWDQGKGNEFGENVKCELCSPTMDLEQWNNRPTERVLEEKIVRLKARNAELLEALEDCRDVLEDYAHIVPFLQARERAEAAIAKAKGE